MIADVLTRGLNVMLSLIRSLKGDLLSLFTEEERIKVRGIAERHALRREMDAEVDGQGRRWDSHGQEVSS